MLFTLGRIPQVACFEEIDLIAYIKSTTVTLQTPQFSPGVFYMVYLTEAGNTEPIALDNYNNNQTTLIYGVNETVSRIISYGLEPVDGVKYHDIYSDESPVKVNFDIFDNLPMGTSKYFEKVNKGNDAETSATSEGQTLAKRGRPGHCCDLRNCGSNPQCQKYAHSEICRCYRVRDGSMSCDEREFYWDPITDVAVPVWMCYIGQKHGK